ncbi:MAG: cytochrome ubiquinol oxidase subunit I [Gammaproteobacteria bacterium]|nr:cytochrome ubiquinol oxidase subunit I [Gammaproteobacteria bacterium]
MDDPILLARIQFGLNIGFHILFPSISIGLAWVLFYLRLRMTLGRGDTDWLEPAYYLWVKVFALTFALGVVTGIVMSFQFGTNWPGFMNKAGNVAGPLLAYEVLTAFFLEATFLGVMLYGRARVPGWLHLLATFFVAFGTTLSAFWILALNSWMHTPQGFSVSDGVLYAEDWWAIIFNPSQPYRLAHMLIASGLTVAFLIAGVSALQLLRERTHGPAARMLRIGVIMGAMLAPVQMVVGDLHGLNTLEHQPAKIAAMEAIWHTEKSVPLVLFAVPNAEERRNDYAITIPYGASLILKHDPRAELTGLDAFDGEHPPVAPVFFAFRLMVGIGVLMLALSWWGAWQLWRSGGLGRGTLRAFAAATFIGWVAVLAGWIVTEVGRQPFLVQGVITVAEAASAVPAPSIALSLLGYAAVYAVLLIAYVLVLTQLTLKEVDGGEHEEAALVRGPGGAGPRGSYEVGK